MQDNVDTLYLTEWATDDDTVRPRLIGFIFLFGTAHRRMGRRGRARWVVVVERLGVNGAHGRRRWGTQSKEQGRPTAAAYSCLPVQIYSFLAQCKDYQRELYGCALTLRRFIDLQCSPRHRMSTALGNKCILGLWVPSMERQEPVLRASWAKERKNPALHAVKKHQHIF